MNLCRNSIHWLLALGMLCSLPAVSFAQSLGVGDAIYVDFGSGSTTTEGNWNNITSGSGSVQNAVTEAGITTSINISLPDPYNGVNESGTTDGALGFPGSATRDNLYGNDVLFSGNIVPTAQLLIEGLDPSLSYEVTFFASRLGVGDNRQTEYAINGAGGLQETLYLDPANNVDTQAVSKAIWPTDDGVITVDMQKGPENSNSYGFFYIGVFVIRPVVSLSATQPDPAMGADDVRPDVVLSWSPGQYAVMHDVYFGTVMADVENASRTDSMGVLVSQGQTETTFDPAGELELGQTYYWRIDEVNAAPGNEIYTGSVWSFTAEPLVYTLQGITATSNTVSEEGRGLENAINGSGVNENDGHSIDMGDMWSAAGAETGDTPYVQFEFDGVYKMAEIWVWNYNFEFEAFVGVGLQNVTVEYSVDGADWTLLGDVQLAQGSGASNYLPNTIIPFDGVAAKYVRMTINSNYGADNRYGLSELRFLYTPAYPREPQPADGATNVDPSASLSWRSGRGATSHEVYFGDDTEAAVTTGPSYVPAGLDYGATYAWKVVEINDDLGGEAWESPLWTFSTQKYRVVDDFESYNDAFEAGTAIWQTWLDGLEDTSNGTSFVGNDPSPFAELEIVRGGLQSMPFFYENASSTEISETDRKFAPAQDWTTGGLQSLALWFHGDEGNTGRLYAKINDVKVYYDGDAADIAKAAWQPWSVDLSDFATNLAAVSSMSIGVEGTGVGKLCIDDVRLYPKAAEFVNLAGYYMLDGNADDASGSGNNGAINGDAIFVEGLVGQAISLDGIDDHVVVADTGVTPGSPRTVSGWAKADTAEVTAWTGVFGFTGPSGNNGHFDIECVGDGDYTTLGSYGVHRYGWERDIMPIDLEWHHLAATYDGATVSWYGDGQLVGSEDIAAANITPPGQAHIGKRQDNSNYFAGSVDEVRIYDRALSVEELAGL